MWKQDTIMLKEKAAEPSTFWGTKDAVLWAEKTHIRPFNNQWSLVLHQFQQLCCHGGNWKHARCPSHRNKMKFCSTHYKVRAAHLWPGFGTPNQVTQFRDMKFPCSFYSQQGTMGTSNISWNMNQSCGATQCVTWLAAWAARAPCFNISLGYVPTHRQDKAMPSN